MDLDTFITTLYVIIDDWYKENISEKIRRKTGPKVKMSDSEVLTVAIIGQWRIGVPWSSERSVVRYMQTHGRGWFPTMLQRSAFNTRVRNLWSVFVQLQQDLAEDLRCKTDIYEVADCVPLPAYSNSQGLAEKGHWLWWSTKGYGGTTGGFYFGEQAILSVLPGGAITAWLIGSAHSDDRWFLQALISQRAGQLELVGPPPAQPSRPSLPPCHIGPAIQARANPQWYLVDAGFNGQRWPVFWLTHYHCQVIAPPSVKAQPTWSRAFRRWFSGKRQIVETCFAILSRVFDFQRLNAHSRWGQYTRIAIATAAFNLGILINRSLDRPDLAHQTLIC